MTLQICTAVTPYCSGTRSVYNSCGDYNNCPGGCNATTGLCKVPSCTLTTDWDPVNKTVGTIMRWTSANSTGLSINNGIGAVTPVSGGNRNIYPQITTTYTGTATGTGGSATCTTTVNIAPPATGTITITPASIVNDNTATLTWTTANADAGVFIYSSEDGGVTYYPTFGGDGSTSANGSV